MAESDPFQSDLELWGGLECTVARIGERFRNQVAETGHQDRREDLEAFAKLGISTVRYPVVWETVCPDSPDACDWSWHDDRLARLRDLGVRVIATLCHHGGGPRYTSLLDPNFPALLARHAEAVARRYPWIELYTPVNEPLTTARFSALYGHWHPHARDYGLFLRALLNECKATALAMRAIRAVRRDALLVQTEDLGKTFSPPLLSYQARHDNERRWLTFDLLCGRVRPDHPFWGFFTEVARVKPRELTLLQEGDAAPDIIGINHYLTSDRFLDERVHWYPDHLRGDNGKHAYADAEAVRTDLPDHEIGAAARLRETWARYRRPIAVTEVHHGCTRDEQLRWLAEVWEAARTVRAEGADIRAVTIWSLFGTVDWNTLLTEWNGAYEVGAFDVRGRKPRPTALARAAAALAKRGTFDHPVLDRPGWWRRDERFYRKPARGGGACRVARAPRRLLVTGATGTLGGAFSGVCDHRGLDYVLTGRRDLDIADKDSIEAALACHQPWAVVNTAGYVRVADAEREPEACLRENASGAGLLARACAAHRIPLVTFSSDLVFDGRKGSAYVESDRVSPQTVYGASKATAEEQVLAAHRDALVIRTSAFFGPWDRYNFVFAVLQALSAGKTFSARRDVVSMTYVPDLVHVVLDLLIDGERGVWHLANQPGVSWSGIARLVARRAGLDPDLVLEQAGAGPVLNTSLSSERGLLLPPLESAVERFFRDCEVTWTSDEAMPAIAAQ